MKPAWIDSIIQRETGQNIPFLGEVRCLFAPKKWTTRLAQEVLLRVIADTLMVNLSLAAAFAVRFYVLVAVENTEIPTSAIVRDFQAAYLRSFWLITLISLAAFFGHGFYTYGRAYCGRFKALIVIEATTLSFLVYSSISLFTAGAFPMPRGVIVLAWGFTLVMLLVARLWASQWTAVVKAEERLLAGFPANKEKHVLVIGGAGYIGSALLRKLLEKEYTVRVLDLLLFGIEPIQDLLDHPNLELIEGDFRHLDTVVDVVRGADTVVHLGAIVGDPACALNEQLTIEVNLSAARMIAEVAKGSGVKRFVFASTCSVYGASSDILDEQSQLNPVSLYACTKMAVEWALKGMAGPDFMPTILRFGTIYGLSGRTRFDLVINLLTAKAFTEGQITVFGGDQWRPFVHVQDAAAAILKVMEAPVSKVGGQIFNVGSNDQNYTIQQAAELIHGQIPAAELIQMGSDTDPRNYRVSFDKIRTVLDFVPEWTVESGVQQVLSALQNGLVRDYREAKCSNAKFLKDDGDEHLPFLGSRLWDDELISRTKNAQAYSPAYYWSRPDPRKQEKLLVAQDQS